MKNLAELQAECVALGIKVEPKGRASKEPYIAALRDHHWRRNHPFEPLPAQIMPMLLGSWEDLDEDDARQIEQDFYTWIIQPKMDGVRVLLHIEEGRVRITSRTVSEVTYRLSEFLDNLPHLTAGWSALKGTVLDGELVCPVVKLDTGSTITETSLQATTAILATSPDNARRIQDGQAAHVRFHVFDILRYWGKDVTPLPLIERQDILEAALRQSNNPFVETVPSFVVNKPAIHDHIIAAGDEGTVWKMANSIYLPGQRVTFWVKRKRGMEVEAFISGGKPGTNGHAHKVGAIQFSSRQADGAVAPVGWVSSLSDRDRNLLTDVSPKGDVRVASHQLGRRAVLAGQDLSARSRRMRHARLVRWIDPIDA